MDPAAAKQYVALFQNNKEPYSKGALQANADKLASLVRLRAG